MEIFLSVVIPTFRRTDSIVVLLEALKDQSLKAMEVLVIDQNQPGYLEPNIPDHLKSFARIIHQAEPNVSAARNLGYHEAKGQFILFVDDDLEPTADFCQKGVDILQNHKEIGCLCPLVYNDLGEKATLETMNHLIIGDQTDDLVRIRETISAAIFFRRETYLASGGFDELLFGYAKSAEDQELFLRMQARKIETWLAPDLPIFHNEGVPGGCDLRTDGYWKTREKCIKSWVFRYRIHGGRQFRLSANDLFRLSRSAFLNKEILKSGFSVIRRQIRLLSHAITETRTVLEPYADRYRNIFEIDHLSPKKDQ